MSRLRRVTLHSLAGLLALVTAVPGGASSLRCKSDPVVLLSDGTAVDLTADIGTALWNVSAVNYTLHVPSDLSVVLVLRTPNWPGTIERFRILRDNPPQLYSSVTSVQTRTSNVGVTVNMLAGLKFASVSGKNGQNLPLQLTTPGLLP